jgi:hypothetical protein
MDKTLIQTLAMFCADQHEAFQAGAWLARHTGSSVVDRVAIAVVAKYLSMTSWYGHAVELEAIAAELHPPLKTAGGFDRVAQACEFDPGRFSVALRYRLAIRQIERSVRAGSGEAPNVSGRWRDLAPERRKMSGPA